MHCLWARMLWERFFFAIAGASLAFPYTVLQTVLSWEGALVGKNAIEFGRHLLYAFFGQFGRKGTGLLLTMKSFLLTG